jgi:methyl-accepting chemotaxis protein
MGSPVNSNLTQAEGAARKGKDRGREQERLEPACAAATRAIREALQANKTYQKQLEERLVRLPDQIAQGIEPNIIAGAIQENLRQQFVRSAIPETAQALALVGERLKKVTAELERTAKTLSDSYQGVAETTEALLVRAADMAQRKLEEGSSSFHRGSLFLLCTLCCLALLGGIGLGMLLLRWTEAPLQPLEPVKRTVAPTGIATPFLTTRP